MKPLAAIARTMTSLGFGFGNVQPGMGPLFVQLGYDRTLGGALHEFNPLDGTGWQRNLEKIGVAGELPVVAAIRHLHRSAFAQLRWKHRQQDLTTEAMRDVNTSAASRVLIQPNGYETTADFLANLADQWLTGEVLIVGVRNERTEPASLHIVPRHAWGLRVDPETREAFYLMQVGRWDLDLFDPSVSAAAIVDAAVVLPARNVVHLRWATPRHPLIGESAFAAAGLAAGINVALNRSQFAFVVNMRRVSAVVSTDVVLNRKQMTDLRDAFDEQAKSWATGGLPIMSGGMKMSAANLAAIDPTIITSLRYSNEEIARCVGVPPQMIGDLTSGGITDTETLIRHWFRTSLGGLIERCERAFEPLFGFDGRRDFLKLDTDALFRMSPQEQADVLSKLTQGGVLKANEARKQLGEGPAEGGDQLFVQRQMVPLTLAAELAQAELDKLTAPPPPPPPPPTPEPPDDGNAAPAPAEPEPPPPPAGRSTDEVHALLRMQYERAVERVAA